MSNRILYYFPGIKNATRDTFVDMGLGHAVEHCGQMLYSASAAGTVQGPDAGEENARGGVICATRPEADQEQPYGYKPAEQEWVKCDGGKFWVGWDRDAKPTCDDLEWPDITPGYLVPLSSGDSIKVPLVRLLDMGVGLDGDGNCIDKPLDKHRPFFDAALAVQELRESVATLKTSGNEEEDKAAIAKIRAEQFRLLGLCLGMNYRVSRWELGALTALSQKDCTIVAYYVVDGPAQEAILNAQDQEKKTDQDSNSA